MLVISLQRHSIDISYTGQRLLHGELGFAGAAVRPECSADASDSTCGGIGVEHHQEAGSHSAAVHVGCLQWKTRNQHSSTSGSCLPRSASSSPDDGYVLHPVTLESSLAQHALQLVTYTRVHSSPPTWLRSVGALSFSPWSHSTLTTSPQSVPRRIRSKTRGSLATWR